jgi:hypothetical protein
MQMSIVKGYYNINNGVFLGPMTATSETGEAYTPRYVEGICFGDYNTQTQEFVPLTNPMHIPKGMIYTQDEQITADGKLVNMRTGIEEDKGADFVSKRYVPIASNRTPNVETRYKSGKIPPEKVKRIPETNPKVIVEATEPNYFTKSEMLEDIYFDNLF